jgi:hypothetical protein
MPEADWAEGSTWDAFIGALQNLQRDLPRVEARDVNSQIPREQARSLVRTYFRETRPPLRKMGMNPDAISAIDGLMQKLIVLSQRPNAKATYISLLANVVDKTDEITGARELMLSDAVTIDIDRKVAALTEHEQLVYSTLAELVPSAARSYKQAILDLADSSRISYRGPANDLREALRETLDHLAQDQDLQNQDGFQFEKGQTKPTRKQKVRFILKARGMSMTALKVPEGFVEAIEEKVSVVVSATYGRVNNSAHVQTERIEVQRIKVYVDTVLSELLSLPSP